MESGEHATLLIVESGDNASLCRWRRKADVAVAEWLVMRLDYPIV